ncbi:hypothetical protein IGI04_034200 [Brassica rapa subsp. trilocularis]|uniref:Arabidopsis retrotransposon Orf1 C-terminal domain-containing protein n=1 Tax=Brassica rapa subsp. trilocularis TaxID=1813537 RepID=A0ABQ7LA21_BRACM|nr:hypothetical protein IGI04_034200 [Brassica rapa subsp. trilocularis]
MTNEELARLERQNRQQPRTTDTNMGDHGNMDDLTAALALIQQQMQNQQQQMQQMQQTIQNQQQAAQEQAAENAAREERDDIAAKMDQLLKGNQSQVFIMEEATPEKNAGDKAFEAEQAGDDQQEVSYVNGQGWQLKNYHPNPNVRNNPQLFWPKQDKQVDPAQNNQGQYSGYQKNYQPRTYVLSQPQSNQPQIQNHQNTQVATSTPVAVPQDETKTMLQQLLQGQQLQGKALNQVTTEINTRMNHMFGDLSTKYDNVASHMRQMDIQIAQTAESVKRQQGTLPGKTDKNPKECNAVQLRSGKQLSEPERRRFTAAEKGKQKESEQPPADQADEGNTEPVVETASPRSEQPAEAVRPIPEAVPPREYIPKVPYPVPAKVTPEQSMVNIDADGYAKMLDSAKSMGRMNNQRTVLLLEQPIDCSRIISGQLGFCLFKASPFTFPFSPPYTDPPLAISSKQTTKSLILNRFKWFCFSFVWNLEFSLFLQITSPVSTGKRPDNPNQIATNSMARTKQSAKRTRATCSTPPPQVQQQTSASYPWPREQEGELIDLDSPLLLDFNCEGWDKGTAARYNALLRVDMLPTRFCHTETLADLGIDEDVFETLHAIGIAPLCYTSHELYPDLVRQMLATATITYEGSDAPSYANCSFSFMADGEYCRLSLDKLNEIYEMAAEPKGVAVAKKFSPSNAFWDCIANGNFTAGKVYQSQIRNPALRVIAKIISNLLFAKELTSKVTNGELQTLYTGIEDEIRASGSGIPIQRVKTNPGFNFITMICERRQCLMHGSKKKDRSGSLLTPLFKHFGIDLTKYSVNKEVQYLDIRYLMACHIMRDEDTYSFFDKAGTQLFTKLPHPEITRFSVFENIRFLPPPELLCTDPRAAVPDENMDDVEDVTPEADPSYDLGELADVTDDHAYRRWMVDSQRKNNSLMRRILHLITGGCIGGSDQRQSTTDRPPRSHRPGKEPMGTGPSSEEVHRSRNRRSLDPAESGESD